MPIDFALRYMPKSEIVGLMSVTFLMVFCPEELYDWRCPIIPGCG